MKKMLKSALPPLIGAAYASLAVLLSRMIPGLLAPLFEKIGPLADMNDQTVAYGVQVLAPLQTAHLISPWIPFLTIGAALGALAGWLLYRRRPKHIVINLTVWLLLLIPLALVSLWFTFVNGILVGNLISMLLPLLPHLL